MSEIKVNKISPKQTCTQLTLGDSGDTIIVPSGVNLNTDAIKNLNTSSIITQTNTTTITLGYSGATIAIASGASQTGFGRTGTVNWDTTPKTTSPVTAVSGNGYFINTTSGAITVNLPSTPAAGDIVAIADYANTSATNNITIGRNGSKIDGEDFDAKIKINGQVYTLVYIDSTEGWKTVFQTVSQINTTEFVTATGGTITTCGNFKIHTFTGPGSFVVSNAGNPLGSTTVDYLVIAGGGGSGSTDRGGGGGAGGYRESYSAPVSGSYTASPLATPTGIVVSATTYPITVGAGGDSGSPTQSVGVSGSNSIFSTITSAGGGGGGKGGPGPSNNGVAGGSGGGGGLQPSTGGAGNTPPVSPPQGNAGGTGSTDNSSYGASGGGGGATAVGVNNGGPGPKTGGAGGAGATTSISGSAISYAGGGTGYGDGGPGTTTNNPFGGGGRGANADANKGGGGGATNAPAWVSSGGKGGSGIVIIRYKYQ